MSTEKILRKEFIACSVFFIIAAGFMTEVLFKTPANSVRYLLFSIPYVFLFAFWIGLYNVYKKFGLLRTGQDEESQAKFRGLRSAVQIYTFCGVTAIAIALPTGFILGRLASH